MKPEPMIAVRGLSEGFDITIDSKGLSGNVDAGIGHEECHHAGNVIGTDHAPERYALEIAHFHRLMADTDLSGPVGDDLVHARSFDNARQNGIDSYARGSELLGKALGKADDSEF